MDDVKLINPSDPHLVVLQIWPASSSCWHCLTAAALVCFANFGKGFIRCKISSCGMRYHSWYVTFIIHDKICNIKRTSNCHKLYFPFWLNNGKRNVRVHRPMAETSGFNLVVLKVKTSGLSVLDKVHEPKIKNESLRLSWISAGCLLVFVVVSLSLLTWFPVSYLPCRTRSSILTTEQQHISLPVVRHTWSSFFFPFSN